MEPDTGQRAPHYP